MSDGEADEASLRRLVAVLSQASQGLAPLAERGSVAELLDALMTAEAAAHRVLTELRRR